MNPRFKIGMRNIKTALSVGICLVFFQMLGVSDGLQASITAVICMKSSLQNSIQTGVERTIGTVIGAVLGILALFAIEGTSYWLSSLIVILGVALIIYLCNVFKIQASVVISIVVFLIILVGEKNLSPVLYGLMRLVETVFGIIAAYLVNRFIDPRHLRRKPGELPGEDRIKEAEPEDLPGIMALWLRGNLKAHPFLSDLHWHSTYDAVKSDYSETGNTFVYREEGAARGYIRLIEDTVIDGFFVQEEYQKRGIGTQLLSYCKKVRPNLSVKIYAQNQPAVDFFTHQGFYIAGEIHSEDENSDQYTLEWSLKA